jgi:hypothetical protein
MRKLGVIRAALRHGQMDNDGRAATFSRADRG